MLHQNVLTVTSQTTITANKYFLRRYLDPKGLSTIKERHRTVQEALMNFQEKARYPKIRVHLCFIEIAIGDIPPASHTPNYQLVT